MKDFLWIVKAFLLQPIIPTRTKEWVVSNGCSYTGESKNGKYDFYWYGNFKTGYQVKIKKIKKNT